MISEGEHQKQDFKYCISDARKIARSFSAFANTGGGRLLIGVRDNGSIAGVAGEEEYYMVESAASLYCKPDVKFTCRTHRLGKKTVLEIDIKEGNEKPYLAKNDNDRWLAYVRVGDQNLLANNVILKVWKIENDNRNMVIEFTEAETKLTSYLRNNPSVTLGKFIRLSGLSKRKAEWVMARLISAGVMEYTLSQDACRYFPAIK